MRVVLTNLSNKAYETSRFQLNDSAKKYGIGEINSYDFEDIKGTAFYEANRYILDQPKGVGNWAWKPYIILETLKNIAEGDIVIYSDCGIEIIGSLEPLITICEKDQPILLFANGNLKNKLWTKRDCFVIMDCDNKKYWNGIQCDAAFCLFRKSVSTETFLTEWLNYCINKRVILDTPNSSGKKNFWGYHNHRFDQSILSLLAIKYSIPFYREPTQYGNHYKTKFYQIKNEFNCISQNRIQQVNYYSKDPYYNSPYFQLLNHHRTKSEIAGKKSISMIQGIIISGKRRVGKIIKWLTRK